MRCSTTVGVDLTKNVIQVSVVNGRGKELSNRALTRKKFAEFFGQTETITRSLRVVRDIPLLGASGRAPRA
jgi:hypothetical protein